MPTRRALSFLILVLLGPSGCATKEERPWYKLGKDYTTAEFNRDRESCTKDKKLDEECMKAKGWVAVTQDLARPQPPQTQGPPPRY